MDLKDFIRKKPLVYKTDPIPHVKNLMNRFGIAELPVVEEEGVIGTITSRGVVDALKKVDLENLLALHLAEKNFIRLDIDSGLKELVKRFLKKKRKIACVFESENFLGYVQRKRLLEPLLDSEEKVEDFVEKSTVKIDIDESLKKLVKILGRNLPVVVLKDDSPFAAFSPGELYFQTFVSDYVTKKIERDYETLRAGKRKRLGQRLNQQLLSYLKEKGLTYAHPIKVGDIIDKGPVIESDAKVGKAAKLMLESKREVLAVEKGGIVSDLSLLKLLG